MSTYKQDAQNNFRQGEGDEGLSSKMKTLNIEKGRDESMEETGWGEPNPPEETGWGEPNPPEETGWGEPNPPEKTGWDEPHPSEVAGRGAPNPPEETGWGEPNPPEKTGWDEPHPSEVAGWGSSRRGGDRGRSDASRRHNQNGWGERASGWGERDGGRGGRDTGRRERENGWRASETGSGGRDGGQGAVEAGSGGRGTGRRERETGWGGRGTGERDRQTGAGRKPRAVDWEKDDWRVAAKPNNPVSPPPADSSQDPPPRQEPRKMDDPDPANKDAYHSLLKDIDGEVKVTLKDRQADPNSPLYSVKSFEALGLKPELLKGVYALGFTKPSKIQERALPLCLNEPYTNLIGQSQSGTGKTAAFVLTCLSRIDTELESPQALVVCPARELARQIQDVISKMGEFTKIKTFSAIREALIDENGYLKKFNGEIKEHIVVGTPGTVLDLLRRRVMPSSSLKVFVLDEADNMLDQQGLGDQSIRIKKMVPPEAQLLLFSATFPPRVRQFASRFAGDANLLSLKQEELTIAGIKQFWMDCRGVDDKYEVLCNIYGLMTVGQSIIFVAKQVIAEDLNRRMTEDKHQVSFLHGGLDPQERDRVMDKFREGDAKVLITTNVLSRGIDIQQVNLVINYDLPVTPARQGAFSSGFAGQGGARRNQAQSLEWEPDYETYLHRVGRTGRFGRTGVAINIVNDQRNRTTMEQIAKHFGINIVQIPPDDLEQLERIPSNPPMLPLYYESCTLWCSVFVSLLESVPRKIAAVFLYLDMSQ